MWPQMTGNYKIVTHNCLSSTCHSAGFNAFHQYYSRYETVTHFYVTFYEEVLNSKNCSFELKC